ncbi:MarR family winged helix-turn-helix transcriptional regulator [Alteraurantiacibacter aquimixticola]|uniref:MarR family winged helix-turn-helix transcriptional regulator n=1 Tax=Alteraurantiacibacter aquimixticola TaxID=2489173 RepID=UPI00145AC311|nr:MarR family winged helix-turn-helix transcriptional regulator [Alteraurantiacibacter aquimixticola]
MNWGVFEKSIGPRARLIHNALSARSIAVSAPYELPTGSLTVMALIDANPGSSQAELAGLAGLATPSMVGIIDELEKRELVTRIRSSTDRRRNDIALTDKGHELMTALFAEVSRIEDPIKDALGAKDLKLLVDLLDRVVASLK